MVDMINSLHFIIITKQMQSSSSIAKHPKVILLGDVSVGKTAILQTLINGQFPQKVVSTMGACFQRYSCRAEDGRDVSMDIWDTAGQQKYRSLLMLYYKNSDVIIMVFDLSRMETFQTVGYWAQQIQQNCQSKPSIILVGNKYDLRKQCKLIPEDTVKNYARNKRWYYYNASALDNFNIKEIFSKAATLALTVSSSKIERKQSPVKVNRKSKRQRESSCC